MFHVLFPVCAILRRIFTSRVLHARLLLEISIHSADACILAESCVGYARAASRASLIPFYFIRLTLGRKQTRNLIVVQGVGVEALLGIMTSSKILTNMPHHLGFYPKLEFIKNNGN